MSMFWTGLVRKQDEFLSTNALGVDVDHELKACYLELAKPKVNHLDTLSF
jgi:hypothetical protein